MMEYMGRVSEIEFFAEEGTGYRFFPVPEDVHLEFKTGDFFTAHKPVVPTQTEVKGREPSLVGTPGSSDPFGRMTIQQHGSGCGFNNNGKNTKTTLTHSSTTKNSSTMTSLGKSATATPDNVIHWFGNKTNPYAGYINREEFDILSQYGCSWCLKTIGFGEPGLIINERHDTILCSACSGHKIVTHETPTKIYVSNDNFSIMKDSESA